MSGAEQKPQKNQDSLLPDPATISRLARNDFFYRYGYHRTELGREILGGKIRALTTLIDFRIAHPELVHNETLLRVSLVERAVTEKVVSLGNITPLSKLETLIFDKDTPTLPA